jgi:arylsulfatase A-like enzyme
MNIKFLKYFLIACHFIFLTSVFADQISPNIILINADDLGYGDLGCYGATKIKTPNIDRLAKNGKRFTDAHSASAVCSPSRYGLLTGQYPYRINMWGPVSTYQGLTIAEDKMTLPKLLHRSNYNTACIGKWHLGFGNPQADWNKALKPGPLECGFDYFFGVPSVNSGPPFVLVENHHVVDYDPKDPFIKGKLSVTQQIPEKGGYKAIGGAEAAHRRYVDDHLGTELSQRATKWIEKQTSDRPFFLYFAPTNIHHPFTPAKQFVGTSDCGLYGDFVHELDWMVGKIISALESKSILNNTLIIFTSDNGGMLNVTGQKAVKAGHRLNGDLLGYKFGAWEGGHRVPFIAHWPEEISAGTQSDQLISQLDLLATFAALTGQTIPSNDSHDSTNQLENFIGNSQQQIRETLIIQPNSPAHLSVRHKEWVYIPNQDEGGFQGKKVGHHLFSGAAALPFSNKKNSDIENGQLKKTAPRAQLYNLKLDFSQEKNVYQDFPEIAKELHTKVEAAQQKIPPTERLGWINLKPKRKK